MQQEYIRRVFVLWKGLSISNENALGVGVSRHLQDAKMGDINESTKLESDERDQEVFVSSDTLPLALV